MYLEMDKLIEESVQAGVLIATGVFVGHPIRVKLSAGNYTVTDGPFIEAKELMGGYALLDVKTLEEAVSWVKRSQAIVGEATNEICPVMSPEDFAAAAGQ
jgi:hypothetical protein